MSMNLGRTLRMRTRSGIENSVKAVMNTKPVRRVSTFMLTRYLKSQAALKGKKLSGIAWLLAFIFDMACLPIEWGILYPMQKLWDLIKYKWAGARPVQSLPSK